MFDYKSWENTESEYTGIKGLKETLLKRPSGFLYIKESKSYGDLVKIGITTHWNNRDRVYQKTEIPYAIEDIAIFGVINLKLSKFDAFTKDMVKPFHCAYADSTEFYEKSAAKLLITVFTAGFNEIELQYISPKYKKYCREFIDYEDGDTQLLFPSL